MEKLVYVLIGPDAPDPGALAAELASRGALRIAVNVSDAHVAARQRARITHLDPTFAAVVSFWLDDPDAREAPERALRGAAPRIAGYSVLESVALPNSARPAHPGRRSPGVNMIACIAPRAGQPHEAWLEYWLEQHRRVALETQATHAYVRNVVVRALTRDAPPWWGIAEESFADEAVGDPMLWFKAAGSPERMRENLGRMLESCRRFLDLERVESHPMSEYRFDA